MRRVPTPATCRGCPRAAPSPAVGRWGGVGGRDLKAVFKIAAALLPLPRSPQSLGVRRARRVIFLPPPPRARAPGKVAVRTAPHRPQSRAGPEARRRAARPADPREARPGTRATVRPREGRPRARDLRPRPPPRSPQPLLASPQPRRDHVGGDLERPHAGPGGDPGVQLQQGQQAPGPHHAVPHRGRGRPLRGGDPGEPGALRTPFPRPWPAGPSRARRGAARPSPTCRRYRPHPGGSPVAAALPPPHPGDPAPRAPSAPPAPAQDRSESSRPPFSALRCAALPRRPGGARLPCSGSGAAAPVHARLASSSSRSSISPQGGEQNLPKR